MSTQQSLPRTIWDGMSRKNNSGHGRWSLTHENGSNPPKQKRGQKKMSSGANKKRISISQLKESRSAICNDRGESAGEAVENSFRTKSSSKFSFEDTLSIVERRRRPESEITNKKLEEIQNSA